MISKLNINWDKLGPIAGLFVLDTALSFLYAAVPTSQPLIRSFIDVIQFMSMTLTMFLAIQWAAEDF